MANVTQKAGARALVREYYRLTKPGIVYSNVMTAAAAYLYACRWHVAPAAIGLIGGTGLIIAGSCVLNNYIDRGIDAKMQRTQKRALVTGTISGRSALLYACILFVLGFWLLSYTNALTMLVGLLAASSYVALYGWAKRASVHGTLVGTIPGAASLVAGYTAVTGRLDMVALTLFAIMVVWQMAHFYAIATFRQADYAAAGIPVRPVRFGFANTRVQIIAYVVAFCCIAPLLAFVDKTGAVYGLAMLLLGAGWVRVVLKPYDDEARWARRVFGHSLMVLLAFCLILPLGVLLP